VDVDALDSWHLAPAIIKVDVKNCFNNLSVVEGFEQMRRFSPSLVHLFHWTHEDPSDIVLNDGTVVGQRVIGFRQGWSGSGTNSSSSLSPVYWALVALLRAVEVVVRETRNLPVSDGEV
jgi:hypothetical protein